MGVNISMNYDEMDLREKRKEVDVEGKSCTELVIEFLSNNRDKAFTVKAIANNVGYSVYSVRRSLNELVKLGYVMKVSRKGTNRKYYTFIY